MISVESIKIGFARDPLSIIIYIHPENRSVDPLPGIQPTHLILFRDFLRFSLNISNTDKSFAFSLLGVGRTGCRFLGSRTGVAGFIGGL